LVNVVEFTIVQDSIVELGMVLGNNEVVGMDNSRRSSNEICGNEKDADTTVVLLFSRSRG